ncbi:D-alanyl-D-alanine carboxypeptidase/D-alanyl-D-alanine-endopeptidase (penicillin-binding protein 4) [Arthrobacter stackebrandtii]|uniref:D-alanyl-D-alanine carboxypeptidase/D-alanyl-D-alanine-endopeptidase (Penicillin-binding protein 4) n=1 Tax=Arthrobacter stackebrandtii TaxID=272161 RepID=A0ABS4YW72_9MICC|nr:D-alanyl-D-alanine carboxypeptidase/D-alanyl-D-alanine-endopeptidase [Arthrobacter stackebrandtii]MBP2412845.1 D-alanyl-D-alanine carboxypeptidase/D-alanyl-D-alanine-endopeptidase (penicillin-binding protein 4) [Arthrobacter stackebrandtii]PYH01337.1 D-alanyl-D-alanine carboxypeptidase/D-alanyl-D-alanine-endopeptidase [Arthrobacter stackebrandtii]
MGRTSKIVTGGLLVCALVAISIPVGKEVVPGLFPQDQSSTVTTPAAQLPPAALSQVASVSELSPDAPLPDAAALSDQLKEALKYDGAGTVSVYVSDVLTGEELFSADGWTARTPASNQKLLTAGAALATLGPQTRFTTRAVTGSQPNQIVLQAGGDVMLGRDDSKPNEIMGHAGIATLAKKTAESLAGAPGPYTLAIDDTMFTGSTLNPYWPTEDVAAGEIAPIYPMALFGARYVAGELTGPRPHDAPVEVAEAFAVALERAGVETIGIITRSKTPEGATELGSVQSATVDEQTQYMMQWSDNYVAEVLGRMVARKLGEPVTNEGAVYAVRKSVRNLGLPMDTIWTVDNSGLSVSNRVSPAQLVQYLNILLKNPASSAGQELKGLPIAGLTGSLSDRYIEPPSWEAAGVVRAKTGTLNLVTALSGYVVNSDGRLLSFAMIGNGLTDGPAPLRTVFDNAATVLAKS